MISIFSSRCSLLVDKFPSSNPRLIWPIDNKNEVACWRQWCTLMLTSLEAEVSIFSFYVPLSSRYFSPLFLHLSTYFSLLPPLQWSLYMHKGECEIIGYEELAKSNIVKRNEEIHIVLNSLPKVSLYINTSVVSRFTYFQHKKILSSKGWFLLWLMKSNQE